MVNTVCEINTCVGCMACIDSCPTGAIKIVDALSSYNAVIDGEKCVNCNACHNVCQNNNEIKFTEPVGWRQGYTTDDEIRARSSSGGYAQAIEKAFALSGGHVCSCLFENGKFIFKTTNDVEEIKKFAGSKYVKSDATGAYKEVKTKLKDGEKVLFVGLPCQVSALKIYLPEKLQEKLYTIDLICHGTPSPVLLEIFLQQYKLKFGDLRNITFRAKDQFRLGHSDKPLIYQGVTDKYLIAFLESLIYTENCYACKYAQFNRVADITLGDSWGSNLPDSKRGVSLALCMSEKGKELLDGADLFSADVDIKKAVAINHQLERPSVKPAGRSDFFKKLKPKGKSFNRLVSKNYRKRTFRQNVKYVLCRLKIIRGGVASLGVNYGIRFEKKL